MTLKDRYWFGGFSGTPPSEPNLSTPPPPPGYHIYHKKIAKHKNKMMHLELIVDGWKDKNLYER